MRRTSLSWLASAGSVVFLLGMAAVPLACASADRGTTSGPEKPAAGAPGTPAKGNEAENGGPGPAFVDNPSDGGNANQPGDVCAPDPSRYEAPGNGCDDDGDGTVDNVASACDTGLTLGGDADQFARAIGL